MLLGHRLSLSIKSNSATEQNMMDILQMLYYTAPLTVTLDDDYGVGSIEYVIDSNMGIEFIGTIQRMHVKTRRSTHRKCVRARHRWQREYNYNTAPLVDVPTGSNT